MPMARNELITIGKIVNAHGHRGWVRVLPLTDFPERFLRMDSVLVARGGTCAEYQIEEAKQYKQFILLKFSGIPNMNAALALKGAFLQITREQLVALPPDTYYIFDLLGVKVYTVQGEYLGELKEVLPTGANDVYVVEREGERKSGAAGRPLLIPALKQVVKEIDLKNRQMRVDLPAGLR